MQIRRCVFGDHLRRRLEIVDGAESIVTSQGPVPGLLVAHEVKDPVTSATDWPYRYVWEPTLQAPLRSAGRLLWIMLNPSTADHRRKDPTTGRCVDFARRWGYGAMVVANAYAWRDTSPRAMFAAEKSGKDIAGPHNDRTIGEESRCAGLVVVAWGAHIDPGRLRRISEILRAAVPPERLRCLGLTASGHPRHPLYVPADVPLVPWPPAA